MSLGRGQNHTKQLHKLQKLKATADAKCDKIEEKLTKIGVEGTKHRPVCAFVTFEKEEDALSALNAYPPGIFYYCCQRKKNRLQVGEKMHRLEVVRANDPADVKWNNLDISACNRRTRKAVVAVLSLFIILGGMFILFAAKSAKASTDAKYPAPTCSTYASTFGQPLQNTYLASQGISTNETVRLIGKDNTTQTTGDGKHYTQQFVNWAALPNGTNLTDSQKIDLITCYCENGLQSFGQNFLSQIQFGSFATRRLWTYDLFGIAGNDDACFGGTNSSMETNIQNGYVNAPDGQKTCASTDRWCEDYFARLSVGLVAQAIAIVAVTIVNGVLRFSMVGFSKWLKFPSNTALMASIFSLVTLVQVRVVVLRGGTCMRTIMLKCACWGRG